jgi:hypothetical protein
MWNACFWLWQMRFKFEGVTVVFKVSWLRDMVGVYWLQVDSNYHLSLRRRKLYPLSYGARFNKNGSISRKNTNEADTAIIVNYLDFILLVFPEGV